MMVAARRALLSSDNSYCIDCKKSVEFIKCSQEYIFRFTNKMQK